MKGKIYIIRSHCTDDVYYGSTIQKYLSSRIAQHKQGYKEKKLYVSSFEIIKHGDAYIELVEEFEYETKEQLRAREGYWIRNNPCINKQLAGRTSKEYYENNKEQKLEYQKEYQKNNEKYKEYQKKYREKNKVIES